MSQHAHARLLSKDRDRNCQAPALISWEQKWSEFRCVTSGLPFCNGAQRTGLVRTRYHLARHVSANGWLPDFQPQQQQKWRYLTWIFLIMESERKMA